MSKCQRLTRLCLAIGCANNNLSTISGNASRCVDSDHVVADNLEIGHFRATGEFDFCNGIETGTIDGNRLVGDNLGREERLDAQSDISRFCIVFRTGREGGSNENHGHQRA